MQLAPARCGISPRSNLTDDARAGIIHSSQKAGPRGAAINPGFIDITHALTQLIENPLGSLRIRLTLKEKVSAMRLAETLRTNPIDALAMFNIEAATLP
jgi:hypothetical protein